MSDTARAVIIDTDGGVDDAAALWWAVTNPALDVVGITVVWGNVGLHAATASVARVLEAAGRADIPLAVGRPGPIAPAPELRPAGFIHGDDGLGNTTAGLPPPAIEAIAEGAEDFLRRTCAERPGEVSVITVGPLSNLGAVIEADPGFAARVDELVVMGGSVRRGGNALPNAEANVGHDPAAAALVVGAGWVRPPLLVGLDVTMVATLTDAHFAQLARHANPAGTFLDGPLRFYRQFGGAFTAPDCPCHDLLAVMAFADPTVMLAAPELPLGVDVAGGVAWGSTIADFRYPAIPPVDGYHLWRVALRADVDRFRADALALFGG